MDRLGRLTVLAITDAVKSRKRRRNVAQLATVIFGIAAFSSLICMVCMDLPSNNPLLHAGLAGGTLAIGSLAGVRKRSAELKLEQTVRFLPCAAILLEAKGRVVVLNEKARALLGLSDASANLSPESSISNLLTSNCEGDQETCRLFRKIARPDGRSISVIFDLQTLYASDRVFRLVLLTDISDVVAAMEEEFRQTQNRIISSLANQLAHDIRNPLTAISGSAQLLSLLQERVQDGDLISGRLLEREFALLCRSIVEQSARLENLVSELLTKADVRDNHAKVRLDAPSVQK